MIALSTLLLALAICESGTPKYPSGNDNARGKAGERSRYQIMPHVWKEHAGQGYKPSNKNDAAKVAILHLEDWSFTFHLDTGRYPTLEETYALWSRPGMFMKRRYDLRKLPKVVQARCARFAAVCRDLEERGGR